MSSVSVSQPMDKALGLVFVLSAPDKIGCSEVYAEWPGSAGRGMQGRSPASPGVF